MVRKIELFFKNIYDVDNEFYEKEEGAIYGPGIADWPWVISFVCTVIANLQTRFFENHFFRNCGHDNSKTINAIDLKFFELT